MEILKQLCAVFNITILVTGELNYCGTDYFEKTAIEKLVGNELEKYIDTFKDVEIVI